MAIRFQLFSILLSLAFANAVDIDCKDGSYIPWVENCTLMCTGGLQRDEHGCAECKCNEDYEIEPNRFDVRIVDGSAPTEGLVEVHIDGKWGVICDKDWSEEKAAILCKEAGFHHGIEYHKEYFTEGMLLGFKKYYFTGDYGNGNGKFLMSDVNCQGNELSISKCEFKTEDIDCSLHKAVSVNCTSSERNGCGPGKFRCDRNMCIFMDQVCDEKKHCVDGTDEAGCSNTVRLINGVDRLSGRIEFLHNGVWGSICGKSWDDAAGQVVCTSLGFHGKADGFQNPVFGYGTGPTLLQNILCSGLEHNLDECEKIELSEGSCPEREEVSVECKEGKEITEVPAAVESILPDVCGTRTVEDSPRDHTLDDPKLTGESNSTYGAHPWLVRVKELRKDSGEHLSYRRRCTGTIISEFFVISTTRCVWPAGDPELYKYVVVVGDFDKTKEDEFEKEYTISRVIPYDDNPFLKSITLLKIKADDDGKGIQFNSHVAPACLATPTTEYTPGTKCVVTGWGGYEGFTTNVLQSVNVQILRRSNPACMKYSLSAGSFCVSDSETGEKTTLCDRDHGGPLVCENSGHFVLYGVAGWSTHCVTPGFPAVYDNVRHHLGWIYDKLEEEA